MTDIILEIIRALFLGIIVAIFLLYLRQRLFRNIKGWKYIFAGFVLQG